ncbi:MAG TPA: DUF305 domain-containing protein [Streptosporangiaceae bacterium]|jgi:uncharacterized protein (DUF305 family)|nr:DUF305 domain-containing protein [Streptosporangiaceae bacterium]
MISTRSFTRHAVMVAVVPVTALVLAGCGGSKSTSAQHSNMPMPSSSAPASAATAAHNAADAAFATDMIQHHRQAVQMAQLASSRAGSGNVKALAAGIEKAQAPEIKTMSQWLTSWGQKVPEDMSGMNMSSMPGIMSDQEMAALKKASGKNFDTKFLTMMIGHHQGALQMATTEKQQGAYGPAKTLASNIITSQTAEITKMKTMLGNPR